MNRQAACAIFLSSLVTGFSLSRQKFSQESRKARMWTSHIYNSPTKAFNETKEFDHTEGIEAVWKQQENHTSTDTMLHSKKTNGPAAKFKSILAALSFENHHDRKSDDVEQPSKAKKVGGLLRRRRRKKKRPQSTDLTRVECGSSNSGDDVFYDALQFGDAVGNQDAFQPVSKPRESIVLSGISIEAVLDGTEEEDDYDESTSPNSSGDEGVVEEMERPALGPKPPQELPLRFLRAGKNDREEGVKRYMATLKMRAEEKVDTILREPNFNFATIKQHYPHYCHGKGKLGEPCFYEQPPRTNLKALRESGVSVDKLLRHYTMVTEYQWQYLERDDLSRSIYIIDLAGMRMSDFAGEAVEFLKKASKFSAEHYPERAGYVFVINVPAWFKIIWNVVKPIIDESTLEKIYILRGKEEIRKNMQERIPLENIPPEYGGNSVPLGQSQEEKTLADWVEHNNELSRNGQKACTGPCRFCDWAPARSY